MEADAALIHDEMSGRIIEEATRLALREGAGEVSVRKIIRALGVTNRVFYNRFHNVEEVLSLVYQDMTVQMRQSILDHFDPEGDFFGQITEIAAETLRLSYRLKLGMNQYVFIQDSTSADHYLWWRERIREFMDLGKEKGLVLMSRSGIKRNSGDGPRLREFASFRDLKAEKKKKNHSVNSQ